MNVDSVEEFPAVGGAAVVHKPIDYGTSYGKALQSQGKAGTVQQTQRVMIPTSTPKKQEAKVDKPVAAAPAAPARITRPNGMGTVKAVPTGDTLVLVVPLGPNQSEEITLTLSGISVPKICRGQKGQPDEPFAWEAREFLRKKVIGQRVSYSVIPTGAGGGRDYAVVKLGDEDLAQAMVGNGWATANVKPGAKIHADRQVLLDLQEQAEQKGLGKFNKELKAADHVRDIDWAPKPEDIFARCKNKVVEGVVDMVRDGSTYKIEIVAPNGRHEVITLNLAGVNCPRTLPPLKVRQEQYDREKERNPNSDRLKVRPEDERAAPYANEVRAYAENLLLHRDVGVVIAGMDKTGNLYGSLRFPKGNISEVLLKHGMGTHVGWTGQLTDFNDKLVAAEAEAKAKRLRLWQNYEPQQGQGGARDDDEEKSVGRGGSVNDQQFHAKVSFVASGDTLQLTDDNGRSIKVRLASVEAPRMGFPGRGEPDAPWAVDAKEFLRKKLAGRRVKVIREYVKKAPPQAQDQAERVHVTIFQGKLNINEAIVAAGLADVLKHRMDEQRAASYDKLLDAERQAIKEKRNKHSGQKPKVYSYVDLTERIGGAAPPRRNGPPAAAGDSSKDEEKRRLLSAKAKQFLPFFQKDKNLKAVVEHVFSGSRFKIFIDKENAMVFLVLAGIKVRPATVMQARRQAGPPKGQQQQAPKDGGDATEEQAAPVPKAPTKPDAFGVRALELVKDLCLQQDVRVEIETMDKGDNFIGNMFVRNQNIGLTLLEQGLAELNEFSAARSPYFESLKAAQDKAQAAKIGIWENWRPPSPKKEVVADEKEESKEKEFGDDEVVRVRLTEVVDSCNFYAHLVGNKAQTFVEEHMSHMGDSAQAGGDFAPKKGTVCAGLFTDDKWHRVRVESPLKDGNYQVFFIDYGNHDELPAEYLRPLNDKAVQEVEPLAKACTLACLKPPSELKEAEHREASRQALVDMAWERDMLAKVLLRDATGRLHISLFDEEAPADEETGAPVSVNQILLREGLARLLARPDRRLKKLADELRNDERAGKDSRLGVWEYGDVSDPEDEGPAPRNDGRPPRK